MSESAEPTGASRGPAQMAAAIFLVLAGGVAIYGGTRLRLGSLDAPGPGLMPLLVGLALAIVGVILGALFGRGTRPPQIEPETAEPVALPTWLASLLVVLLAVLIPILGFYTASFGFIMACIVASRRLRALPSLFVSIAAICTLYAVFELIFRVNLPAGQFL